MKPIAVAVVGTAGAAASAPRPSPRIARQDAGRRGSTPGAPRRDREKTRARAATKDYQDLVAKADLQAVYISATPESTHYSMARDFLAAGKHVFLEKPIALELAEADELIKMAKSKNLKFTIGYSQRFNPKYAYVRKTIRDGTNRQAGERARQPAHHPRPGLEDQRPHQALAGGDGGDARPRLRAVCLEPARPVRVYSQVNFGAMRAASGRKSPTRNGSR